MSIQSEAERIKANVASTYAAAAGLGAEMPGAQNSDNLSKTVAGAKAVLYAPQELTAEQQAQARNNIGALAESELDAAVDDALAQAKASGDFKGDTGDTGPEGPRGEPGPEGPRGPAYTLTEADKAEMVAAVIAALPVYNGEVVPV